jgi:sec-independent protein translocase protein TatC
LTKSFILLDFPKHRSFIFTDMAEALFTYFYLSFLITCFLFLPFLAYNSLSFFKSSFYEFDFAKIVKEVFLFFTFNIFSFYVFLHSIIPRICKFFLSFEQKSGVILLFLEAKISSFLSFFLHFIYLNFIISFVIFFAIFGIKKKYINFLSIKSLRQNFFFLSILFSGFISPPDILSQISMTFFLVLMYEFLFFYAVFRKGKEKIRKKKFTHKNFLQK